MFAIDVMGRIYIAGEEVCSSNLATTRILRLPFTLTNNKAVYVPFECIEHPGLIYRLLMVNDAENVTKLYREHDMVNYNAYEKTGDEWKFAGVLIKLADIASVWYNNVDGHTPRLKIIDNTTQTGVITPDQERSLYISTIFGKYMSELEDANIEEGDSKNAAIDKIVQRTIGYLNEISPHSYQTIHVYDYSDLVMAGLAGKSILTIAPTVLEVIEPEPYDKVRLSYLEGKAIEHAEVILKQAVKNKPSKKKGGKNKMNNHLRILGPANHAFQLHPTEKQFNQLAEHGINKGGDGNIEITVESMNEYVKTIGLIQEILGCVPEFGLD